MRTFAALTVLLAAAATTCAAPLTLYDGALGTMPDAQGWKYVSNPPEIPPTSESFASGVTTLDTSSSMSKQAGYFSEFPILGRHPSMPATLDRTTGFRVLFNMKVTGESHVDTDRNGDGVNDRGGYSVIALSSDKKGIELTFWDSQVFGYDRVDVGGGVMDFVHAESTSGFDPTAAMWTYDLLILGGGYTLSASGTPILSGPLRDYSGEGFPYTTASFLFLGDDTGSASSITRLSYIAVDTTVPEPTTLLLTGLGGLVLAWKRRR